MKMFICAFLLLASMPPLYADEAVKPLPKIYQIPFRLTNTNHVLVRVKINGKGPFSFILDTGAPALFVTTDVGKKLGVTVDRQGWGTLNRFELEGGVVIEKAKARIENPFQLEGMNGLGLAGTELHGIIGYTILARYRLEFDFSRPNSKMDWMPLDFKPPEPLGLGGQGAPANMEAMGGMMKLMGALLGKKMEQRIILRGFLGFRMKETDAGLTVSGVLADSPAAKAGLQVGDRIVRFQNRAVDSLQALQRLANTLGPEETAELKVSRGHATVLVSIKAGKGL
jgi:hypothetical protein